MVSGEKSAKAKVTVSEAREKSAAAMVGPETATVTGIEKAEGSVPASFVTMDACSVTVPADSATLVAAVTHATSTSIVDAGVPVVVPDHAPLTGGSALPLTARTCTSYPEALVRPVWR